MFETLAVLVVFFFLLIFGASFYFKLQENSLERQAQLSLDLQAVQIAQKSLTLPELRCPFPYAERRDCIDIDKAKAFKDLLSREENARISYLENTFGFSSLTVNTAYTAFNIPEFISIYDQPRLESEGFIAVQLPVLLYSGAEDRRGLSFGYIEVKVYE
jgi:hypothetical protein